MNKVSKKVKKDCRYAKNKTKKLNIKKLLVFGIIIVALCIIFSSTMINKIINPKSDKSLASMSERINDIEENYDKTPGEKAKVDSVKIFKRETGEGPFDNDDNPGNDSSAENDRIRTLDYLKYTINVDMVLKEEESESIYSSTIKIVATLPEKCRNKARWDLHSMSWVNDESFVEDDGLTFVGYYTMKDNSVSIPGTQALTLVAKVLYAENEFEFAPNSIKASIIGNTEEEAKSLDSEIGKVTVSATDMYDIVIMEEHSNYSFIPKDEEIRLNSYLLGFKLQGRSTERGLKGVEKPKDDINFDIAYNLLFNARKW